MRYSRWSSGQHIILPGLFQSLFVAACAFGQANAGVIDHVRILAKDMGVCQNIYRNTLGFDLAHADAVVYEEGSSHNSARLGDGTYIELVGVSDREKLQESRPWIVDFLREHQGLHSVGVLASSAKAVSDHLQTSGIDVTTYNLTASRPGEKPIQIVTPKLANLPDGAIFFLEYPPESLARRRSLPPAVNTNSAQGILAVWIVVKDLSTSRKDAETLGFRFVRTLESQTLRATGQEFETNLGNIVLLQGSISDGPTARFIRDRSEGVMGLSLEVKDFVKTRALIETNAGRSFAPYTGFYGKSFLIPAELSCGAWIEMVQK